MTAATTPLEIVATGLRFPEGPIAMPDGSVILVEMAAGLLSRVGLDGQVATIAECGGGPNGAAIGPDGRVYVCNNGGFDRENDPAGHFDKLGMTGGYQGGSIQAVDIDSGLVETMYTECNGHPLRGPNDIVFDTSGGFWFTDHGKSWSRQRDHGGLYYATTDGRNIEEVIYPLSGPNGVGVSASDGLLYVSETDTGRLYSWPLTSVLARAGSESPRGTLVHAISGARRFDSLAIDSAGHICVATLGRAGGILDVAPDGSVTMIETGDALTTNVCFGGADLRTAYVTCSASGTLRTVRWARPGSRLAY